MNSRRIVTVFMILSIVLLSPVFRATRTMNANGYENSINTSDELEPQGASVEISKKIITKNDTTTDYLQTFINETFTVLVEVENKALEDIYNVTIESPEINVTNINSKYKQEWFTFAGALEKNWSSILAGEKVNLTFSVTPHHPYNYTFPGTSISYSWVNGTIESSISNSITFEVYEEAPTVKVEKSLVISEEEQTKGRIAINGNFTIQIKITNLLYEPINVSALDAEPVLGLENETAFSFNSTLLRANTSFLSTNSSFTFSYRVQALLTGNYTFEPCMVNATLTITNETESYSSNKVKLEVYQPIYDGDDWTLRTPLITVSKYFLYNDEQVKALSLYNTSLETVTVQINISNSGVVTAHNITIEEEVYRDWVFDTEGVGNWTTPVILKQDEWYLFNYTITPKILGDFQIEPTVVKYSYFNQRTLLPEVNHTAYSNMIEISIVTEVIEESKAIQWWIAVGLSFGVIILAVIPFTITFFVYRKRKKTQKGA